MRTNRVFWCTLLVLLFSGCGDSGGVGPSNSPTVTIESAAANRVVGTVFGRTSGLAIVLWAKTDQWYVQPYTATPFTSIDGNGGWSSYTHPWNRIVALLVDSTTYIPGATRFRHPAEMDGVVAWDEYPARHPDRVIDFGGMHWIVKSGERAGPGPNYFSEDSTNVLVRDGELRLAITERDGRWYCGEIVLERSLGYGTYTFQFGSRVDSLDPYVVASGFIYADNGQEVDIEWSQWLAAPDNMQYVIQPWSNPGNIERFGMPAVTRSTHRFQWMANAIVFTSWRGWEEYPPPDSLIRTWTYIGGDIPTPGEERMRFNLWLVDGMSPAYGRGNELIVHSFRFQK
jgi:hypothetical protein